jgi:hypothetical protein
MATVQDVHTSSRDTHKRPGNRFVICLVRLLRLDQLAALHIGEWLERRRRGR